MPISSFQPWVWCGLSLNRAYTFPHNVCEFVCATVALRLENTVSCSCPSLSVLAPAIIPRPWEETMISKSHVGLNIPQSLILWALTNC